MHVAISAAALSTLSPLAEVKLKKAAANIMNKSSQAFSHNRTSVKSYSPLN
jgi:hypothetical protein